MLALAFAQFPPPLSSFSNVTVLQSPANKDITIRFKSPLPGTCTTVFSTQKQYTGYVTIPPDDVVSAPNTYPINTFFWFIEARQLPEKAPLTIWLNGGPGSSSMIGLFQENGPCRVVEIAKDKLGTVARDWGWDRSSNMLYIDQPVQVGFSYDTLTNASTRLISDTFFQPPIPRPASEPEYVFLNGTFASGKEKFAANTSDIAAEAVWHFLQTFLIAFPEYNAGNRSTDTGDDKAGINLFAESYGGRYGPAIVQSIQRHNKEIEADPVANGGLLHINVVSLGIMNGLIDILVQGIYYARFGYKNTYGLNIFSLFEQQKLASNYRGPDGCQQKTEECRSVAAALDPSNFGNNDDVNSVCAKAGKACDDSVNAYAAKNLSIYDITQTYLDPFPEWLYLDYLNDVNVQDSIGVPINYTTSSDAVYDAFLRTGDIVKEGSITELAEILESGIRIALIYGDRDFICNWLGGEAVSFAIAGALQPKYSPFYTAGYAPIIANESYIGGAVRQFGNLSFSRIYDAGHLAPAYQPETAFTVFTRIIQGEDIGTGAPVDLANFDTRGDANATYMNTLIPEAAKPMCYLRNVVENCDEDQQNMLANRAGVIINGILYASEQDWVPPDPSVVADAGVPGTLPAEAMQTLPPNAGGSTVAGAPRGPVTTTVMTESLPTGVYTATGTPVMTTTRKAGSANRHGSSGLCSWLAVMVMAMLCMGWL